MMKNNKEFEKGMSDLREVISEIQLIQKNIQYTPQMLNKLREMICGYEKAIHKSLDLLNQVIPSDDPEMKHIQAILDSVSPEWFGEDETSSLDDEVVDTLTARLKNQHLSNQQKFSELHKKLWRTQKALENVLNQEFNVPVNQQFSKNALSLLRKETELRNQLELIMEDIVSNEYWKEYSSETGVLIEELIGMKPEE